MSGSVAVLVRTFKVGGFECTLTFPKTQHGQVLAVAAEWSPDVPERLTAAELAEYHAGRNAALADLAKIIDGDVAVIG